MLHNSACGFHHPAGLFLQVGILAVGTDRIEHHANHGSHHNSCEHSLQIRILWHTKVLRLIKELEKNTSSITVYPVFSPLEEQIFARLLHRLIDILTQFLDNLFFQARNIGLGYSHKIGNFLLRFFFSAKNAKAQTDD